MTPCDIIEAVAAFYHTSPAAVTSVSRKTNPAKARHAAAYAMRNRLSLSFPEMARRLGRKDHTTVMSALYRAEMLRTVDADFRRLTDCLTAGRMPDDKAFRPEVKLPDPDSDEYRRYCRDASNELLARIEVYLSKYHPGSENHLRVVRTLDMAA